jgi:hypothetical protein
VNKNLPIIDAGANQSSMSSFEQNKIYGDKIENNFS